MTTRYGIATAADGQQVLVRTKDGVREELTVGTYASLTPQLIRLRNTSALAADES